MSPRPAIVAVAALLCGCASLAGGTKSEVAIATDPANGQCMLKGRDGFVARVDAPARVTIPNSASPVMVTCTAEGRRPTRYALDATPDGWVWGNAALAAMSGGVAVLGLLVDGGRDAGMAYADHVTYRLDPDTPRRIEAVERDTGRATVLETR